MKIELQNVTILDYCAMLRCGIEKTELTEINELLSASLGGLDGGMDLSLFMLQKDLLIFQCKAAIAYFEFDNEKLAFYEKKIDALRKELEKKTKKAEKPNPYESFLSWLSSVEQYKGSAIDKNNDLLYFSVVTKQMLNHYEQQKANIEANKVKK